MSKQESTPIEVARIAVQAAEAEHVKFETHESDTRQALEIAATAVQTEGSAGAAGKVLLATEDAVRLARLSSRGSSDRLRRAKEALASAQAEADVAALAARAEKVAPGAFVQAAAPLVAKLVRARRALAEATAGAETLVRGFIAESAAVHGTSRVDFARVLDSLVAGESGTLANQILAE